MNISCVRCHRRRDVKKLQPLGIMSGDDFIPVLGLMICRNLTKCRTYLRPAKMKG